MNRWLLALLIVALAFPVRLFDPDSVRAADKDAPPGAPQDRRDAEDDPAGRIDKAILEYETRADQDLRQIRKEITQLRTELGQLSELQYDLAVSLAELQAELKVQAASNPIPDNSGNGPASGSSAATTAQERQRIRAIELARELRQVQDSLRNLVQQKRGETDQLVLSLRNLRAQQRQAAAERERNAQASKPIRDN